MVHIRIRISFTVAARPIFSVRYRSQYHLPISLRPVNNQSKTNALAAWGLAVGFLLVWLNHLRASRSAPGFSASRLLGFSASRLPGFPAYRLPRLRGLPASRATGLPTYIPP